MKLTAALACLALVGLTAGAVAQTTAKPPTGTAAKTAPDTSAKAPPPAATAAPSAADQFKDEASAKAHCPSDAVVWVNLNSKAYHASGTKYYGKTKNGAYECQKEADTDGFHAAGHKKTAAATKAS